MSNQETRFVRCSTDRPIVILSHKVNADALLADSPADILYSESSEYWVPGGNGMIIDMTVMDAVTTGNELNYVLSIGGESPGPEYARIGTLQYKFDDSVLEAKQMPLRELHMFTKNENVDPSHHRPQPQNKEQDKSKAKELINKHLDDLIEQAALLKGELDPLERADAYERLHFSMSRLELIESAQFQSRPRIADDIADRRNLRRPDIIYRESSDSYYTPEGEFIETREQRDTRLWGDNRRNLRAIERDRRQNEREVRRNARKEQRGR